MAPRGRPKGSVKYKPEDHMTKICDWLSDGKTLRDYCRQKGTPSFQIVYEWLEKDRVFSERFARSRETGHDVIAQECLQIADERPPVDDKGKTDSGYVSWQKNRIWTRTQLLSKWSPKKYGDQTGGEDKAPGSVKIILSNE